MEINKDFKFKVSLSMESFENKEISTAMMGSMKYKSVREKRKKYGYKPNRGVSFVETTLTSSELLDKLVHGHVFCYCFNIPPQYQRKDQTFGAWLKTRENFKNSWCISVDIDKTFYPTPHKYIDRLSLKPTFWYTTYSHLTYDPDKDYDGIRFRMVYIFDQPIENIYWFRFIATRLLSVIKRDTEDDNIDECSASATQYFNGTNKTMSNVEYGCSDIIYGKEDLIGEITPWSDEFIDYLKHGCDYKEKDDYNRAEIKNLLERLTDKKFEYNSKKGMFEEKIHIEIDPLDLFDSFEVDIPQDYLTENMKELLWFFDNRSIEDFKKVRIWNVFRKKYKYIYRLENPKWNRDYQVVGDDYFSLPFYHYRIKDGNHRRKKLYHRCCLRKYMYPTISNDELIFNYIMDVIRFIDDPNRDITSEVILKNVNSCLSKSIEQIEECYGAMIEHYRKITRPKRNIIRKDKSRMTKEFTFQILDDYYNEAYDIEENHILLKDVLPFSISLNYLYQYTKSRGIKNDKGKVSDEELLIIIQPQLSGDKNLNLIREHGYKCKKDRLYRLLKLKRA